MPGMNWYGSKNKMASLAGRSLRGASRVILQVNWMSSLLLLLVCIKVCFPLQAASLQCGRIASQGMVFTNKLEVILRVCQMIPE